MGSDASSLQCTVNNTNVLSTLEEANKWMYTGLQKITATYVLPIILLVGLLGNSAFLFVVIRIRSMRTVTNFYLANLAVSDMTFLTIVVVKRIYSLSVHGVPNTLLGAAGCISKTIFTYTFHFAGLFLITFMSMERYIAVCHPLRHRLINARCCTAKLVISCWLSSMIIAGTLVPTSNLFVIVCVEWPSAKPMLYKDLASIIGFCTDSGEAWLAQRFHLTQTIPFFVAFFGNAYFYARILLTLHFRNSSSDRQRIVRTRNRVAVMLVANGVVFFLTLTAFEVTSMILFVEGFQNTTIIPLDIRDTLFEANRVMLYVNSAINPFVYTLTNARYRQAFKRAFIPQSWGNGRPKRPTIFSTFPDYYSQYHANTAGLSPIPPSPTPAKTRLVARPATYSNACFDQDGMSENEVNVDVVLEEQKRETSNDDEHST